MSRHTEGARRASRPLDEADQALLVISSDTHVGPAPSDLRPYCPSRHLDAFDEFAARAHVYNESYEQRSHSHDYFSGRQRNLATAGHADPAARLRDMDRDGVAAGVIFADSLNGQPFPFDFENSLGNGIPAPEARELAGVGRALYNRWLADFCSVEPERQLGLAQLPFWDMEATLEELEWCAEHGLGGINFPSPDQPGLLPLHHPDMEPFYAACAALGMTLATHIGALPPNVDYGGANSGVGHFGLLDSGEWGMRTLYQLVLFGVFDRHVDLRFVLTEVPGVYWQEVALKMDSLHNSPMRDTTHDRLQRLPSECMATNVWMGNSFQSRQEAVAAIDIGREERFLWGSDYPHPEGTYTFTDDDAYPMTRLALANTYHGLPPDAVRAMVGLNALDAYPRLDPAALREVAARIGPAPSEIATAPDLDQHPHVRGTGTMAFRTEGAWS
jgi:predicted TIM-barrel fold metal-dependent hydrolase